jgi:hypothetical protein
MNVQEVLQRLKCLISESLDHNDEGTKLTTELEGIREWVTNAFQYGSDPTNVALFDMDGSLFDHDAGVIEALRAMRSPEEPEVPEDLWALERAPHMKARMDMIRSMPGWWRALKPIENGLKIYKLAQEIGFSCEILTKGPRTKSAAWMEKLQCCQEQFGADIDVHIVSDNKPMSQGKGGTYGKLLYDDYPIYMLKWLKFRPRGLGIMPVTVSNKDFQHPQVIKWDGTNFDEVKTAMQFAFDRKPGETLRLR